MDLALGMTDSIRPFVCGETFDAETLQAMSDAFDKATALMADQSDEAIEDVAIRIITQASQGESDPDKLAAHALAGYGEDRAAS